jgi:hypothetical protein
MGENQNQRVSILRHRERELPSPLIKLLKALLDIKITDFSSGASAITARVQLA